MRKLSTDLIKSGSFTGSFSGSVIGTVTSASFASTSSYLLNSFSLTTGSSYPITSSWSNKSITSSYSITSSNLSPVAQDLVPISNSLYSLGSPTNKWKDLYVSTGSIYIGDTVLSTSGSTLYTNTSPVVTLNTASGQIEISGISASLSASYATNAGLLNNTSSTIFATTGSNNFNGNQTVQGNITIVGSLTAQQYVVSSSVSYFTSSNFDGSTKFGDTDSDTHQFTGSLRSPNITGSLLGTSSFSNNSTSASYSSTSSVALNALTSSYINVATNAVSSSYASTASISVSSSFATTSSYNLNSISSSYSLTASFAANAGSSLTTGSTYPITASWSNNSISSSYSTFAVSSNSATSANTATSASYATVAGSSTSATTANSATSASYSLTSSYSINSTTATSSSFASTASYNLNSISSSFSVNSLTASYIVNSISSSYALTASYALNAGSGGGSTTTSSLIGQTFVPTASVSQLSLTQSVSNNDQILVILDGLVQSRTGSYTVSGSTLTLTENADSGSNIDVRFLGGSAVSSSYALTSSYLTDGSQILTSDRTVAFSSSFTTAQMQALIDAQPRNLGGKTLTFQFADGNYNLSTGLQFNFFSNGVLLIYGNSSNNTVAASKNVVLSGSAPIYLGQNNTYTEIQYLRASVNTSTYGAAIQCVNSNVNINLCSFTNHPTSVAAGSGVGVGCAYRGSVWVQNSYFTSLDKYMTSGYPAGFIYSSGNLKGTNANIAYEAYGGIIQVQDTNLTSTTTYSTAVGGLIVRPSGTTVGT